VKAIVLTVFLVMLASSALAEDYWWTRASNRNQDRYVDVVQYDDDFIVTRYSRGRDRVYGYRFDDTHIYRDTRSGRDLVIRGYDGPLLPILPGMIR